jgi:hypothetical protein
MKKLAFNAWDIEGYQHTYCINCKDEVRWEVSAKGKNYLASSFEWKGDMGGTKRIKTAHRCNDNNFQPFSKNLIVEGSKVIIVKGRKYPKGTVAKLVKIIRTQYGVCYSLKNGEETYFVSAKNCKVA